MPSVSYSSNKECGGYEWAPWARQISRRLATHWKSAEFSCWGAHKLKGTRDILIHAHIHTHILQVENGSVWLPDWPVVICGHYSKVYQRSQKQGLVWCARHKKHTSTTATLESWFWSGWLEATKFLAKLIEIQIENHGMYPSWPKGGYRIRRRFSHYTVLYFDNLWYRCHIWLT